jgi:O-Antigen ligase
VDRGRRFPDRFCLMALLAIVTAAPILHSPLMDRGFEVVRQGLAVPLAFGALAATLAAVSPGGPGFTRPARLAVGAILAFAVVVTLSTWMSDNLAVAVFGSYYRREGWLVWAAYCAVFMVIVRLRPGGDEVSGLLRAMVLAGCLSAIYALQQRFGLDFYLLPNRDPGRAQGTLGNPTFLGAYVVLLLPPACAFGWTSRGDRCSSWFWWSAAALLAMALWSSQSRGPLAALVVGLALLACILSAWSRAWQVFAAAVLALCVAATFVVAVNLVPVLNAWAREAPLVARMVFDMEAEASSSTRLASRSVTSRLGMWDAGNATFLEAPIQRQLLGYGPDSANDHYYSHIPAEVMRSEAYAEVVTFDRLHADVLDMALNLGALAWLAYCFAFAMAIRAGTLALFGNGAGTSGRLFLLCTIIGAAAGMGIVFAGGLGVAVAPTLGLGLGLGWAAWVGVVAWKAMRGGVAPLRARADAGLLAGMLASLLVFWLDAQINIPVLSTRVISFCLLGLVLAMSCNVKPVGALPAVADTLVCWGMALAALAAMAVFLPAVPPGGVLAGREAGGVWLHGLALAPAAMMVLWLMLRARRATADVNGGMTARDLCICAAAPLVYAALHIAGLWRGIHDPASLLWMICAAVGLIAFLAVLAAWRWQGAARGQPLRGGGWRLMGGAVGAGACAMVGAVFFWLGAGAELSGSAVNWAQPMRAAYRNALLSRSAVLVPFERQYRTRLLFEHLGRAVQGVAAAELDSVRYAVIEQELDAAERTGRQVAAMFPEDPWVLMAMANVLQVRALGALRRFAPAAGEAAAREAEQLFARAYALFPAQPLLLRNWAQLKFDMGYRADAYALLDRMEAILPDEPDAYLERMLMAQRSSDAAVFQETLTRARNRLAPLAMQGILDVVNLQQSN